MIHVPAPAEGHLNVNIELGAVGTHPWPSHEQPEAANSVEQRPPGHHELHSGTDWLRTDFVLNAKACGHPTVCPLTHLPPGLAFPTHPTKPWYLSLMQENEL